MKRAVLTFIFAAVGFALFVGVDSGVLPLLGRFFTPIRFYGRVVDQYGNPVPDASVYLSANDGSGPRGEGSDYHRVSDADGRFSIRGIRGISLFVKVSKEGYYRVLSPDREPGSEMGFDYAVDMGHGFHQPDKHRPAVLLLHKAGVATKLGGNEGTFLIPKDGTPRRISLHRGITPGHVVEISCQNADGGNPRSLQYDWHFKISVPNGELLVRNHKFDFEAPLEGYRTDDEFRMPADGGGQRWRDHFERSYFIRFHDGVHARLDVRMMAFGRQKVILKSRVNSKPGSGNLEEGPGPDGDERGSL